VIRERCGDPCRHIALRGPLVEAAPCRSPGLAGDASIGVGAGSPARAHLLLPGARKFTDLVDVAPVAPGTRRWGGRSVKESQEDTRDNPVVRSEEHTSELQSRENLVCRLLLEKKKTHTRYSSLLYQCLMPPHTLLL